MEQRIYESLVFKCANDGCEERIPLRQYRSHLTRGCKVRKYARALPAGAAVPEDKDVFTPDDDEMGNPYEICLNSGNL